ncbi:MAG: hypothetical protein AB7O28_03155 [Vicinamibacterales bacterium]
MSVDSTASIRTDVAQAAREGRRLEEGVIGELASLSDILSLGALADEARRRRHATTATYVRVWELPLDRPDDWTAPPPAARELRLVGVPASADAAMDAVRRARALAAERVVRGFSTADLGVLGGAPAAAELARAGLDELAWIDVGPEAVEIVGAVRRAGLAARVLGAERAPADRVAWLLAARALVDAVGGIDVAAPLPRIQEPATPTTGFDDVRTVALARIALDQVASIQVDWSRYGPKLAQVALTVGADDLDAVSAVDDPARGPRRAPLAEVLRNITAAGLVAAERDARHRRLAE